MAATGTPTPNLGLRIPQGTDPASVDDINYNSNLLDTKIGAVGNDSVQDQIDSLNSKLNNYATIDAGNWTPTFERDTATNIYAYWQRIGNILFITAVWNNTHGSGASYINNSSLPLTHTGYAQNYGFHGTWRSNTTDSAGEVGQYAEGQNMRFSKGGVGVELPNEPISMNAFCILRNT